MLASTLVFLLIASSTFGDDNYQCVTSIQQTRVSRMRESADPLNWLEMASKCSLRDDSVLLQSYMHLSDGEKMLCNQQTVPLGFFRDETGNMRFQNGSFIYDSEPAIGRDLLGEHDEAPDEVEYWEMGYAALDLTTGRWHLVKADSKFSCALCQQAPVTTLADYSSDACWENLDVKFYRVELVLRNRKNRKSIADQSSIVIAAALAALPKSDEIVETNISRSSLEIVVRVDTGSQWNLEKLQNVVILSDFFMTVQNASTCPEVGDEDSDQAAFNCSGGVLGATCLNSVNATQGRFSTRLCEIDDDAGRPAWGEPLTWQAAHQPCSNLAQYASDVVFFGKIKSLTATARAAQLRPFLDEPLNEYLLDRVADLVSRELRATNELISELRDDLVRILATSLLDSYAVSRSGAQLTVSPAGASGLETYSKGISLSWEDPIHLLFEHYGEESNEWNYPYVETSLVTEYHHVTVPRPQVALAVSPSLIDSARRVAFFTLWPQPETLGKPWHFGEQVSSRYLEVSVVFVGLPPYTTLDWDSFVDITYRRQSTSAACATWDKLKAAWDYGECTQLVSLSVDNAACRCLTTHAELHEPGNATVIRIALRTPQDGDLGTSLSSEILQSR